MAFGGRRPNRRVVPLDFVTSAARWLRTLDPKSAAPGFVERLGVAAARGRADGPRSIAAPYYLTDLGVRRFDDPSVFLEAHLALLGPEHRSDLQEDAALLAATPADEFGAILDAFVLLTGDYESAHGVAAARFDELLTRPSASLLVQVGVLFAAVGDERVRPVLLRAAEVALHPTDRFMALHRLAAAEIKRFGRPEEGLRILQELDQQVDAAQSDGVLSAGDREALLSVTANLRALALLRTGHPEDVRAEIVRSRDLHTLDDLREVVIGEASRYGAQERINLAQVLSGDGEDDAAVDVLGDNVAYCRTHSPDYVGEALTALAYGQLRAARFEEAAATATLAAERIAFEASPARLRVAREIQVASYFSAADLESATSALRAMEGDPLGLLLSRPHLVGSESR